MLEFAMNTRSQVSEEINETSDLLQHVQNELRQANKPIGPSAEDAEHSLQQYEVQN